MKKTTVSLLCAQLFALLLACSTVRAGATSELRDIRFTAISPTSEKVVLQLNGSYSPNVFTIKDETPRLVIDFADMVHTDKVKRAASVNGAMVKQIRVGMHSDGRQKTRVVLDLATLKDVTIDQDMDDQTSTFTIKVTRPPSPATAATKTPAEKTGGDKKPAEMASNAESPEKVKESAPVAADDQNGQQPPADGVTPAAKDPFQPPVPPAAVAANAQAEQAGAANEQGPKAANQVETPPSAPADTAKTATKPEVAAKSQPQPSDKSAAKTPAKQAKAESTASSKPAEQVDTVPSETVPAATGQASVTEAKDAKAASDKTASKVTAKEGTADPKAAVDAKPEAQAATKAATAEQSAGQKSSQSKEPSDATAAAPAEQPQPAPSPATKTEEKAQTATATAKKSEAMGPMIESVKFDGKSPKGEMVMFKLNEFHPPSVHGVEEGIPRVICDFKDTQLAETAGSLIKTDGKYVKVIRISKSKKPDKVRVVLDLEPNKSYDLQQVFFKEEQLFVLIINTVKS